MTAGRDRSAASTRRPALATFTGLLAAVAFIAPLWAAEPDRATGLLLFGGVVAELVSSFRRKTAAAQQRAWASAGFTLLLALVVLNSAWLAATAVAIFVAAPFALDALRHVRAAVRQAAAGKPFLHEAAPTLGNLAAVAAIALIGRYAESWVLALAAGMRLLGVTFNLTAAPAYSEQDADESCVAQRRPDVDFHQPVVVHHTENR